MNEKNGQNHDMNVNDTQTVKMIDKFATVAESSWICFFGVYFMQAQTRT